VSDGINGIDEALIKGDPHERGVVTQAWRAMFPKKS
jgi:hypothetical protein